MGKRRLVLVGASALLAAFLLLGGFRLAVQTAPAGLVRLVFEVLEESGFASGDVDPDRPPIGGKVDEAEILRRRFEQTALLRGAEPAQAVNPANRTQAARQLSVARAQTTAARIAAAQPVPAWRELGPAPILNGQVVGNTRAAVSGRVTSIEIDPANANIAYVGTANGGLYRTTDGGNHWTPIFDTAQSLAIGALALAPSDPTILYVGTGEANGSLDSFNGVGLFRIEAARTTATVVGPIDPVPTNTGLTPPTGAFTGRSVSRILVHPTSPGTLFVSTVAGVAGIAGDFPLGGTSPPLALPGLYRSTNATAAVGSVAFERIAVPNAGACSDSPCTGNRDVSDTVIDPSDPNTLVLWQNGAAAAGDGGIWRTTNALATPASSVTFAQALVPDSSFIRGAFATYKQGASAPVVYVASGESATGTACLFGGAGALRVSTNGGATWSAKLSGGGGFCGGQCFYDIGLAVRPGPTTAQNDDVVLLGGSVGGGGGCTQTNALSTNGGQTFADRAINLHADTHAIKIAPSDANVVYHGNDGGVFRSDDGGTTWASLNNLDFKATQYSGLAVHPTDPSFTLGGTQDNGTILRRPDGTFSRVDFGDGGFAAIDQNATDANAVTMYHTYFNQTGNLIGFARVDSVAAASEGNWAFFGCGGSSNGINCFDNVLFYAPMVLGPGNPNTVYFGTDKLYRSANKGVAMAVVSQDFGDYVSAIGVSKLDDNVRLVGLLGGGLFYTTTGSTTLTDLDPGNVIPDKYVGRIVVDPRDKTTAYVALNGYMGGTGAAQAHVWKVSHLDTTPVLTPINGGLPDVPVNALTVDPRAPIHLFAGTDIGVYESTNGGVSWHPYGTGLPTLAVFDMAIPPGSTVLRIATHGRGLWEVAIPSLPLTLTLGGTGSGTVTSNPPGISCGPDCSEGYAQGTQVTLTAAPAPGSTFVGWGGACGGSGPCTVTVDDALAVTATFNRLPVSLKVARAGIGGGAVASNPPGIACGDDCSETYAFGAQVTLTATPAPGSVFTGWDGACTGTGPCVLTMDADKEVVARFGPATRSLTVTKSGGGTGLVTGSEGGLSCGATCTAGYLPGAQVLLTATPAAGSQFVGWGGACSGTSECILIMDADKTVTASFALVTPALTVLRGGAGSGSVSSTPTGIACGNDCGAAYALGSQVTLTATPAAGSQFAGWAGDCSGSGACQVTIDAPKAVIAIFQPIGVRVGVGRQPGGLTVSLTARPGCGTIDHVRFGSAGIAFSNASVSVTSPAGGPEGQTAGFTYTPPAGTTSLALTIQRVAPNGGATVSPISFVDGCGEWKTFVGGGPDAFR